jgi:hypothetical protein
MIASFWYSGTNENQKELFMKHTNTHPMAEKLQVNFYNEVPNPGDGKKKMPVFNQRTDLTKLQNDFKMREEAYDVHHEFEIQYEQFITNISGRATKHTRS